MTHIWPNRLATMRAMALLVYAAFLTRFVQMSRWRSTLGQSHEGGAADLPAVSADDMRRAAGIARRVARAAKRLPREPKCLAQAMALQWLLRRHGIQSQLVLAMDRRNRSAQHGYHAWVELGGVMLIGQCKRDNYHVVLGFVPAVPLTTDTPASPRHAS